MLGNILAIDPLDEACYKRLRYCEFNKKFVDVVTEKHHVKKDPDFGNKIKEPWFIAALIHLILDDYQDYLINGQPEFDPLSKNEWTLGDRKDRNRCKLLIDEFVVTNNKKDFITIAQMNSFRRKHKKEFLTISSKRFNEIVKETFNIEQSRQGKAGTRGWAGIKKKADEDDMDN
jgi:hypothetical protein